MKILPIPLSAVLLFFFTVHTSTASNLRQDSPRLAIFGSAIPLSVIRFQNQRADSKVLGVSIGHIFGDELNKSAYQWDAHDEVLGKYQAKRIPSRAFQEEYIFELASANVCPLGNYFECLKTGFQYDDYHSQYGYDNPATPQGKIVYFSNQGTDIMVVEFDITYEELRRTRNIVPFIVSESLPKQGDLSAFYSSVSVTDLGQSQALQLCQFSKVATVDFDSGKSRFENLYKYRRSPLDQAEVHSLPPLRSPCRSLPGDSGSPVINPKTMEIIGVVTGSNTVDTLFVTPLLGLKKCIDQSYRFNLYLPSCSLHQIRYRSGR